MNSLPSALAFGVILSLAIPVVSVACLDPLLLSPFFLFCLSWTAVLCFLAAAVFAVLSLVLPYSLGALAAHGKVRLSLSSTGSGTEARVTEKCSQSLAQLPLQRDARTRPENAKDEQRRWGLQRERNDACGDREEARREVGEEEEEAEGQAACRDKAPQREPRSEAAGGEESEAEATGASQVAVEDQQERETKASFVRNCADGMLKALAVPVQKSLFLHFYLLGAGLSLAMALLLSLALRRCRLSLPEKNDTPVSALLSNASPDNIPQGPSSNGQRGKSDLGRLVNEAAGKRQESGTATKKREKAAEAAKAAKAAKAAEADERRKNKEMKQRRKGDERKKKNKEEAGRRGSRKGERGTDAGRGKEEDRKKADQRNGSSGCREAPQGERSNSNRSEDKTGEEMKQKKREKQERKADKRRTRSSRGRESYEKGRKRKYYLERTRQGRAGARPLHSERNVEQAWRYPAASPFSGETEEDSAVSLHAAGMATDADLLLPLLLFFLHCLRRLLEQLFVVRTHATASQMSLAAYLLGLRQATLREKEEEKKGREESQRKDDGREAKSGEEQKNAK
ncbi:putative transmembrane protein [Toxoplasma gondii MAS]|uniref:Putative transmembrane protein n=1 Tax=Toxoplasma gondii MAS TaxID=943118 RepID=A0A086QWH3_TOXGO|nr:putative transmembrane protein [Toxoplasma gondii MAS]